MRPVSGVRRRHVVALAGGLPWGVRGQPAIEPGPWVLADDGAALLQLRPDSLQPVERLALDPPWQDLLMMGARPCGRGRDGQLRRAGDAGAGVPAPTGPLAVSGDGRWLCAVEGDALQLRDASLAARRRWPLPGPVAWLADLPLRRAFVLAFRTRPELWQLSYDERAEPFYDGLVHDYRFGEGVPTPAFHHVRRMSLPEPLLDASADPSQSELAGRGWVFNLDARRRVRLQALLDPPGPATGSPCRLHGRPVLAMPVRAAPRLDLFRAEDWERMARVDLPWPADAVLSHPAADTLLLLLARSRQALLHPDSGRLTVLPDLGHLRSRPRWHRDGSRLWLLTDRGLQALDSRDGQVRQVLALHRPLALA